jgi:hypothetical protein
MNLNEYLIENDRHIGDVVILNSVARYNKTEKSNKLLNTIRDRVRNLLLSTDLDVDLNFDYHKTVRYKPIPEGWDTNEV